MQDRKIVFQESYEHAMQSVSSAQAKQKNTYDKQRSAIEYSVGDKVWLYSPKTTLGLSKKFHRHWEGPFIIKEKKNALNYLIQSMNNSRNSQVVHISRLKPYLNSDYDNRAQEEQQEVVEVEKVLDMKTKDGKLFYLIKYVGFDNRHNKWVPIEEINAKDLINEFHRKLGSISPAGNVMTS